MATKPTPPPAPQPATGSDISDQTAAIVKALNENAAATASVLAASNVTMSALLTAPIKRLNR